jgi:hypothetical protein
MKKLAVLFFLFMTTAALYSQTPSVVVRFRNLYDSPVALRYYEDSQEGRTQNLFADRSVNEIAPGASYSIPTALIPGRTYTLQILKNGIVDKEFKNLQIPREVFPDRPFYIYWDAGDFVSDPRLAELRYGRKDQYTNTQTALHSIDESVIANVDVRSPIEFVFNDFINHDLVEINIMLGDDRLGDIKKSGKDINDQSILSLSWPKRLQAKTQYGIRIFNLWTRQGNSIPDIVYDFVTSEFYDLEPVKINEITASLVGTRLNVAWEKALMADVDDRLEYFDVQSNEWRVPEYATRMPYNYSNANWTLPVTRFRIVSTNKGVTAASDPFYVLSDNLAMTPQTSSSLDGLRVSIDPNFDAFDIMQIQLFQQGADGRYALVSALNRNNRYGYSDTNLFQPDKEERFRIIWQPKNTTLAANWPSNTSVDFTVRRPADEKVYEQYRSLALERLNLKAAPVLSFQDEIPAPVSVFGRNYKTYAEARAVLQNYFTQYNEFKDKAQMPPAYDPELYFTRLEKEDDYIRIDNSVAAAYRSLNLDLLGRIFSPARDEENLSDSHILETKAVMDTIVKDLEKDEFYQTLEWRQTEDFEDAEETVRDYYRSYVFRVQNRYGVTFGLGGGYVWSPWEENKALETNYFYLNADLTFKFTPIPLIYAGIDVMYDVEEGEFRKENTLYAGAELGFFYYTVTRNAMPYLPLGVGIKLTGGVTEFEFEPYFSGGIGLKCWEFLAFEVLTVHEGFDFKDINAYQIRAAAKLQF